MPGGFSEGKTIQHGGAGGAVIPQKTPPLPAETVPYGNFVKFVDDIFDCLAGDDKIFGHVHALVDRYLLDCFAVMYVADRHPVFYWGHTITWLHLTDSCRK